jgi:hypothetical protein
MCYEKKMNKEKKMKKKDQMKKKWKKRLMWPLYVEPVTSLDKCRVTFYWVT